MQKFLPFLRWFPLKGDALKADFMAGITVALVLIPQSMAYAQLAGLPAYYGLYAAFLPVIVAAMWGSSNQQRRTGGGASLLTASSLTPLAAPARAVRRAGRDAGADGGHRPAGAGRVHRRHRQFPVHPVIVGFTNARP
jgi:SulP family sulfate permease